MKNALKCLLRITCLMAGLALSTACSIQVKDKNLNTSDSNIPPKKSDLRKSNLIAYPLKGEFYEIRPGLNLNQYSLRFLSPNQNSKFHIRQISDKNPAKNWTYVSHVNSDFPADPGTSYQILIEDQGSTQNLTISIPQDKVFSGTEILNSDSHEIRMNQFRRVRFEADAQVSTEGKNLILAAEEIWAAPGSTLKAFTDPKINSSNSDGNSGGKITIETLRSGGVLSIWAEGQAGGTGSLGPAHKDSAKSGLNGGSIVFPKDVPDCAQLKPGLPGENGLQGYPGGPGFRGGYGGQILIIQGSSESKMEINYSVRGGYPGPGGQGGKGQDGGSGGLSEFGTWGQGRFVCPKPTIATSGQTGPQGPPGPSGIPGSDGSFCLATDGHTTCLKEPTGVLSF